MSSLTDYSGLENEIKNAPEPCILPAGTEVKARIILVKEGMSEKGDYDGCAWHTILMDVPDQGNKMVRPARFELATH